MIIQYDQRPDATVDEKIRSLAKSIQLALDELGIKGTDTATTQSNDYNSLLSIIQSIRDSMYTLAQELSQDISGIDGRVTVLEGLQPLPPSPAEDGAYVLTVTVTDGTPEYTWETEGE